MEQTHRKLNGLFALLVLLVVFFSYLAVLSPSISFWDCGEYVAVGASLAIPHPPGNPLYVMMARVATIAFFFFKEIAYRINLITPITGALAMMLIYLTIVRAMVGWMGVPDTLWKRISVYLGGIVGALFAAFGNSVLFCAVEAEVNMPQLLPIAFNTWLGLVWAQSKDPKRDRYLLLATYISFLGIGIHMYSMITLLPLFVLVLMVDKEKRYDWRLWITVLICGLVLYNISWFVYLGAATAIITLIMSFMLQQEGRKWRFCFFIALFSLMGFSSHVYIPIRSALNPMIDENHPATLKAFDDYLARKQYGSESMVTRAFWRRGSWQHQLGIQDNMGFGGFWLTQFYHFSTLDTRIDPQKNKPYLFTRQPGGIGMLQLLLYLLPTFLIFFGYGYLYKRNKNAAIMLGLLILICTLGLVFYMNFADGTRSEQRDYQMWVHYGKQGPEPLVHQEVRVRDYFWIGGFMFYGMWIGIAVSALLHLLFTSKISLLRSTVAPIAVVLFLVSPALPFSQNMGLNSRAGDFVPFDYAYNLLMSCERDGIIFTNGDNDTFPLWALQEAYGIRRDVRIVNLSLVNTDWYIKQMKHLDPKVPVTFSDEEIEKLNHQANPFKEPFDYKLTNANIVVKIPGQREQNALRVQDKMVLHVVDANAWRKPIYFAVTVSDDNKMGLDPYLRMEGLAYRVMPYVVPADQKIDIERTLFYLDKVYSYRGLGDGSCVLNETSFKLLSNYAAAYIQVVWTLRQPLAALKDSVSMLEKQATDAKKPDSSAVQLTSLRDRYEKELTLVIDKMDQCISIMPWEWRWRMLRQDILMTHGKNAEAEKRAREALIIEPENSEYLKALAQALESNGKQTEAQEVLKKVIATDPNPWDAYMVLARNYEERGMYDSAIAVMRQFSESHPGDRRAAYMISQLEAKKNPVKPQDTSAKAGKAKANAG
jgi:hypothetical protein